MPKCTPINVTPRFLFIRTRCNTAGLAPLPVWACATLSGGAVPARSTSRYIAACREEFHFRAAPNTGIRAGSLLKAVAFSVTGTYRRVASGTDAAFVLTDDRVGLGTRLAAIGEWLTAAKQKLEAEHQKLVAAARDTDVRTNAPWALDNDRVPSPALLERMRQPKTGGAGNPPAEALVPLADLPPGVREQVRVQQEDWRNRRADEPDDVNRTIREDGVILNPQTKLAVIIPGVATIPLQNELKLAPQEADYMDSGDSAWYHRQLLPPDPQAVLPVRLDTGRVTKRVLAVSVASDADAREAARLARSHRFTTLLIATDGHEPGAVAGFVAAARAAEPALTVWLRTPLLRQTSATGSDNLLDRTVRGDTYREASRLTGFVEYGNYPAATTPGDYYAVGNAEALQAVRVRLTALLDVVPQGGALVVGDSYPPGYSGQSDGDVGQVQELGYAAAMRLAFLRETGTDPVDLSPVRDLADWMDWSHTSGFSQKRTRVSLPFFPYSGTEDVQSRWYAFRAKELKATQKVLLAAAHSKSGVSVYWQSSGAWGGFGEWLPEPTGTQKEAVKTPPGKPAAPALWWLKSAYDPRTPPNAPPMKPAERFARQTARATEGVNRPAKTPAANDAALPWVGIVLDLTPVPLTEVADFLAQIVFAP